MSLANHDYRFVSKADAFGEINREILEHIKDSVIEQVYAVWDCIWEEWFEEAPMLIKTSAGVLSVHVKSEVDIAIGWNDISLLEKPKWFDETQSAEIEGLNWVEDLEWRAYDKVKPICNEEIKSVLFHPCGKDYGVGIGLKCGSGKCLWICDAGDVISARVDSTL